MICARRLLEVRAHVFADDDLLADGVLLRPELFGHGLIDEHHAGRGGGVVFGEVAAAEDGDLEDARSSRARCSSTRRR